MRHSSLLTAGCVAASLVLSCLSAHALNSELPSPGDVMDKLGDLLPGSVGTGSVAGDDDRSRVLALLIILGGAALVAMALFGSQHRLGCALSGFPLFLLGIGVTFFLWWLFPAFPFFLLLIPWVMVRAMRGADTDSDAPSTPRNRPTPAERPRPSIPPSCPDRPSSVGGFSASWRETEEHHGHSVDAAPTEHPSHSASGPECRPSTRDRRGQQ